jgi:hypothetical protein
MQVRIQVNANVAAIQAAIPGLKSLFEKEGITVQAIQVLTPVNFGTETAVVTEAQGAEASTTQTTVQSSASETLEEKLVKLYGKEEPLYVPFNVTSSKRVEGKLLSEYTISKLLELGQTAVVQTVRNKLIDAIKEGMTDDANPFPVRLYWTEKALVADNKLDVFSESLLLVE